MGVRIVACPRRECTGQSHGLFYKLLMVAMVSSLVLYMVTRDNELSDVYGPTNTAGQHVHYDNDRRTMPSVAEPSRQCQDAFNGDQQAIQHVENSRHHSQPVEYMLGNFTCEEFIIKRRYVLETTPEERAFPIAFSILLYKDVSQVERLLRAIYRPQNFYCFHVDASAPAAIFYTMTQLAECFTNVFVVNDPVDVSWGTWSVVQAEILCMSALVMKSSKWRYFINLTGQEFPLKTNLELVRILTALNGSNAVQAKQGVNMMRWWSLPPPPVNVTLVKGECHVAVTRAFVDYVLGDQRALTFRDWVKNTSIPDELYFPSLAHSPQLEVPGAYTGFPQTGVNGYHYITRYKCWTNANCTCHGTDRRWLCILGAGDLPKLTNRPELFANKFQIGYRPGVMECMENMLNNRTSSDAMRMGKTLNLTFYATLPNVKQHWVT